MFLIPELHPIVAGKTSGVDEFMLSILEDVKGGWVLIFHSFFYCL
jgi:hypothetical protein